MVGRPLSQLNAKVIGWKGHKAMTGNSPVNEADAASRTNALTMIACMIASRGKAQGWKVGTKTADNLNLEAWCGAVIALQAINHPDAGHVRGYMAMVIVPRGYRETMELAAKFPDYVDG